MNKASGGVRIPAEVFQILKDDAVKVLHSIHQQIQKTQQCSQDQKMSVFIPIPKKGNAKKCSNYCTIALISHASKSQNESRSVVSDFCNPTDYKVHEILQDRLLEWQLFPSPGGLPNPGIKPRSPSLQADPLPAELLGKPPCQQNNAQNSPNQASTVHEPQNSRCSSWIQKRQKSQRINCQVPLDYRKSKIIPEKHILLVH